MKNTRRERMPENMISGDFALSFDEGGYVNYPFSMRIMVCLLAILPYLFAITMMTNFGKRLHLELLFPLLLAFATAIGFLIRRRIPYTEGLRRLFVPMAAMIFVLFLSALQEFSVDYFVKEALMLLGVFLFVPIGFDRRALHIAGYCNAAVAAVLVLDFRRAGLTAAWNTNNVGIFVVLGIFFICLLRAVDEEDEKKGKKTAILQYGMIAALAFLMLITSCRSALLSLALYFALAFFIPLRSWQRRSIYRLIYGGILLFPVALSSVLTGLSASSVATTLNTVSERYTGKLFFSGREDIWQGIYKMLSGRYILGIGAEFEGNPHSLYMNLLYTVGIAGCIAYGVLLVRSLEYLHRYFDDGLVRGATLIFLSLYFLQSFETIMVSTVGMNIVPYLFLAAAFGRTMVRQKHAQCTAKER